MLQLFAEGSSKPSSKSARCITSAVTSWSLSPSLSRCRVQSCRWIGWSVDHGSTPCSPKTNSWIVDWWLKLGLRAERDPWFRPQRRRSSRQEVLTAAQVSFVELVGPVNIQWFISHSWQMAVRHFSDSIFKHAQSYQKSWRESAYWMLGGREIVGLRMPEAKIQEKTHQNTDQQGTSGYPTWVNSWINLQHH